MRENRSVRNMRSVKLPKLHQKAYNVNFEINCHVFLC